MYPLYLATLLIALVSVYSVQSIPEKELQIAEARSEVEATNFLAYRRAVVKYVTANTSAAGNINDTSLASYWLPGYVRDSNWSNEVSGSVVFVYSTTQMEKNTQFRIYEMTGNSVLVGTKNAATGKLISMNGIDSGVIVPAAIPSNSFVMMGN